MSLSNDTIFIQVTARVLLLLFAVLFGYMMGWSDGRKK